MENEKKIFTCPAVFTRVSFSKDGGLNLGFATNELSGEEKVAISTLHGGFGWLLFKESEVSLSEIPKETPEERGLRTPFERLRNTLYVWWTKRGGKGENFEDFRKKWVEKKIQDIKDDFPEE